MGRNMGTATAVSDGSMTNECLGGFYRRVGEIRRRIEDGTLGYDAVMTDLQSIAENRLQRFEPSIVDLDAQPFIPNGLEIESHQKGGRVRVEKLGDKLFVDGVEVELYLVKEQQNGKWIKGHGLREKLSKKPVLNACLLDHLEKHPELIPESWKGKVVFFWGTIYRTRDSNDNLNVRYLIWNDVRWVSNYNWLDNDWNDNNPAAVLAIHFISLLFYWESFLLELSDPTAEHSSYFIYLHGKSDIFFVI